MKTTTVKVNGLTHQVRRVPCGKADQCKTCKEQGGHLAVYQDTGAAGGARWKYVGKQLPATVRSIATLNAGWLRIERNKKRGST